MTKRSSERGSRQTVRPGGHPVPGDRLVSVRLFGNSCYSGGVCSSLLLSPHWRVHYRTSRSTRDWNRRLLWRNLKPKWIRKRRRLDRSMCGDCLKAAMHAMVQICTARWREYVKHVAKKYPRATGNLSKPYRVEELETGSELKAMSNGYSKVVSEQNNSDNLVWRTKTIAILENILQILMNDFKQRFLKTEVLGTCTL